MSWVATMIGCNSQSGIQGELSLCVSFFVSSVHICVYNVHTSVPSVHYIHICEHFAVICEHLHTFVNTFIVDKYVNNMLITC